MLRCLTEWACFRGKTIHNLYLYHNNTRTAIPLSDEQIYGALEHFLRLAVALGLAPHPRKEMPEQTVVAFNGVGLRLALSVFCQRYKLLIGLPVARTLPDGLGFDLLPELLGCDSAPCTQYAADEFFPISINSKPYPAMVFFDPM